MSLDLVLLLAIAGLAAYWYFKRRPRGPLGDASTAPTSSPPEPIPSPLALSDQDDPFLDAIKQAKAAFDQSIIAASRQHERALEQKFSSDVKLKERLSQFAREQGLDAALIDLWNEVQDYPARSERRDAGSWNKLHLSRISGVSDVDKDTATVEFEGEGAYFKLTKRTWSGEEGETYADISLSENGERVFEIGCTEHYDGYVTNYSCSSISIFLRRGQWAKLLLEYHAQIRLEREKSILTNKFHGANTIKKRFGE